MREQAPGVDVEVRALVDKTMNDHSYSSPVVKPRTSARKQGVVGASLCPDSPANGLAGGATVARTGDGGTPVGVPRPRRAGAKPLSCLKRNNSIRPPLKSSSARRGDAASESVAAVEPIRREVSFDRLSVLRKDCPAGVVFVCKIPNGQAVSVERQAGGKVLVQMLDVEGNVIEKGRWGGGKTSRERKQTFTFMENVQAFLSEDRINSMGFLTLTFAESGSARSELRAKGECERRFNSLWSNWGRKVFKSYICVSEKHQDGVWHFHLLVDCGFDIRSTFNFKAYLASREAYKKGGRSDPEYLRFRQEYSSAANPALRDLWKQMRPINRGGDGIMQAHGFGMAELIPIRSNSEAMGNYVGKYLDASQNFREARDKGVRLVRYSRKGWVRKVGTDFSWIATIRKDNGKPVEYVPHLGSRLRRERLGRLMSKLGIAENDYAAAKRILGSRWSYRLSSYLNPLALPSGVPVDVFFASAAEHHAEQEKAFAAFLDLPRAEIVAVARSGEPLERPAPLTDAERAAVAARRSARRSGRNSFHFGAVADMPRVDSVRADFDL